MMRAIIAAGLLLVAACHSASAQGSGRSRCGWVARGVYACESRYETPDSSTYTLCGSSSIMSACTTKTKPKEQATAPSPPSPSTPYAPPPVTHEGGVTVMRGH